MGADMKRGIAALKPRAKEYQTEIYVNTTTIEFSCKTEVVEYKYSYNQGEKADVAHFLNFIVITNASFIAIANTRFIHIANLVFSKK
jgi:hypothetical protein